MENCLICIGKYFFMDVEAFRYITFSLVFFLNIIHTKKNITRTVHWKIILNQNGSSVALLQNTRLKLLYLRL